MNGFGWRQARQGLAATIVGLCVMASAAQEPEGTQTLPFFLSASDTLDRQGFVRVINHSAEAGEVRIEAIDDGGESYGPVTLPIDDGEAVHFNSEDLENGNAEKGLSGAVGSGEGAWRLRLSSELDIEVLSYVRTSDGFLTSMHDTAPNEGGRHRVLFFNPGSNSGQVSRLRLINSGEEAAEVSIAGVDDWGESPGSEVTTTIPAGASRTFTAAALESGGEGRHLQRPSRRARATVRAGRHWRERPRRETLSGHRGRGARVHPELARGAAGDEAAGLHPPGEARRGRHGIELIEDSRAAA